MKHSVLGDRWVYDGCADPVFVSTLVTTIRTAGAHADLEVHRADGTVARRRPTATVRGTGAPELSDVQPDQVAAPVDEPDRTLVRARDLTLAIARRVGVDLPSGAGLLGSFAGGDDLVLATVS